MNEPLPLSGTLVLDVSRMLPGAALARTLVDLGARVVKIEDPSGGEPMRHTPPLVGGVGAGFCTFFRGVESVTLDLRSKSGAAALRKLARHADVLVESFRPGTLGRWGIDLGELSRRNAGLVTCSLSGFGAAEPWASWVAHDLNLAAFSGLLAQLPGEGVPRVQLVDMSAGLLAATAILAALLTRARTGRGRHLEQPLAVAPLPFLTWMWADAAAGGVGAPETLLAGECPCYRVYECAAGQKVALGALEPKFWVELVGLLGLPELAGDGLDTGEAGREAARRVGEKLALKKREEWLELTARKGLPLTPVNDLHTSRGEAFYRAQEERTPRPDGGSLGTPAAWLAPWARARSLSAAPALGADTERVLREFGVS